MKYLKIYQMTYWKQIHTRLLNPVDNHCWQYTNWLILLHLFRNETHFRQFYLYFYFLVLRNNFNVSGVISLRWEPVLILKVILFSILFTYILYRLFSYCRYFALKTIKNFLWEVSISQFLCINKSLV